METLSERFWSKSLMGGPDECWVWHSVKQSNGYGLFRPDGRRGKRVGISAHRYAYTITHGEIPKGMTIDHICNNKLCINPEHLRICTQGQNNRNQPKDKSNKSGLKGVFAHRDNSRWRAAIKVNGKPLHLGIFQTKEEAHAAYCDAARKHHGEFANFG